MEIDIKNYPIGVMVARFQVDELHKGHHYVIKQVTENHRKKIIFLGVPRFIGTTRNPLDFDSRKKMVQKDYPDVIILALPDQSDDVRWANELDKRVREVYPHGDVLLYGSRDSFIPYYKKAKGEFQTKELEPLGKFKGTDIRKLISEEVKASKDFRSGVIYQAHNSYSIVRPTVDIAVLNEEGKVLLVKKHDESKYRFIGGFVKTEDENLLESAKRVVANEIGKGDCRDFKLLTTMKINDWRFCGENDTVMTTFFKCKKMYKVVEPGKGISELKWFNINEVGKDNIMNEHYTLIQYLKNK